MRTRQENLALLRQTACDIPSGQAYTVDSFRPEDALGIARLYYAVYGDTFPVDSVYDADEIKESVARGGLYYAIGRISTGDVVGTYALFRNPPGRHIMEAGSWIVLPSYRKTLLAFRLADRIHRHPPGHFDLDAMFGQIVCNHTFTQRMGQKFQTVLCGVEVEAMPPGQSGDKGLDPGRVSLLDGVIVYRQRELDVYLPAQYAAALRKLYATASFTRVEKFDCGPGSATTRCSLQHFGHAQMAKLSVDEVGTDFATHLIAMEKTFPLCHAWQCVLPLWRPGSTYAVEIARQNGFFLAGALPFWADNDALLLQKLAVRPDFSRIQLYTDEAKRLLDSIVADYNALECRM